MLGGRVPVAVKAVVAAFSGPGIAATFLRSITISYILGSVSKNLAEKRAKGAKNLPVLVPAYDTTNAASLVYGTVRKSGTVFFRDVVNSISGTSDLWLGIALANHEVSDITDVWLDEERIEDADINGSGEVTDPRWEDDSSNTMLWIFRQLGTSTQAVVADFASAFTDVTSTSRGRGRAYALMKMRYNQIVWKDGVPSSISFMVVGRKIYDPRLDSTNSEAGGTGAHRSGTSSTWDPSSNPALCIRDYMQNYLGVSDADIDDASFATAANDCDSSESIPGSPSSHARYACDGEFRLDQSPRDILETLLGSCAGTLIFVGGVWKLYAGAYQSPTVTLTDADIIGKVSVAATARRRDLINYIRATFVDADRNYLPSEAEPQTDATYEADDGARYPLDMVLPVTTDRYRAQHLMMLQLRGSREQAVIRARCGPRALQLAVWDTVRLTHPRMGYSSKVFRILDMSLQDDWTVSLAMREEDSTRYTFVSGDYTVPSGATSLTPDEYTPAAPTSPAAAALTDGIAVSWTNPPQPWDVIEVHRSDSSISASPPGTFVQVWEGRTSSYTDAVTDGSTFYYRARSRTATGNTSSFSSEVTATAVLPGESTRVDLASLEEIKNSLFPSDARAGIRLTSGGAYESGTGIGSVSYSAVPSAPSWLLTGNNSDYQVRATLVNGDLPSSGTMDTWQALSATRTWENVVTGTGTVAGTVLIEIRDASTLQILIEAEAYIKATVT